MRSTYHISHTFYWRQNWPPLTSAVFTQFFCLTTGVQNWPPGGQYGLLWTSGPSLPSYTWKYFYWRPNWPPLNNALFTLRVLEIQTPNTFYWRQNWPPLTNAVFTQFFCITTGGLNLPPGGQISLPWTIHFLPWEYLRSKYFLLEAKVASSNQCTFYAGSTLAFWFRGDSHILLDIII